VSGTGDWTKLASYGTGLEADIAVAALESAGIPSVVVGHQRSGIFGAGFQGPVIGGVEVRVPSKMLDEAWEIIASMTPRADKHP
jgi:hypothetical protein